MSVWELIEALKKMPCDVVITWIVDGERYDYNAVEVEVDLMLNPYGYISAHINVKVNQ